MPLKDLDVKTYITCTIALAFAVWGVLLLASGTPLYLNMDTIGKIPTVFTIVSFIWVGFAKWGWRWRIFKGWLVPFPDLQGTWEGTLTSSYNGSGADSPFKTIPIHLIVRHSFLNLSCTMITEESQSHSYSATLSIDHETELKRLIYTYINRPKPLHRERSEIHDGTVFLEIQMDDNKMTLKGEYWTNRLTRGEIALYRASSRTDFVPGKQNRQAMRTTKHLS